MADQNLNLIIKARDEASAAVKKLNEVIQQTGAASNKTASHVDSLTASFIKGALAVEGLKKGAQILLDLGRSAIDAASRAESLAISFEVMTGSAELGRKTLQQLQKVAVENPALGLKEVEDGARRLMAMGTSAEQVAPQMKLLGDIASIVGTERLPNIALAFGQVQTATFLTGAELRQFTENSVPLLEGLSKITGKTAAQIKQDMESGVRVPFSQVVQALDEIRNSKGLDMAARQSETWAGKVAQLKDSWDIFLRGAGKPLIDFLSKFVEMLTIFVRDIMPRVMASLSAFADLLKMLSPLFIGIGAAILVTVVPALQAMALAGAQAAVAIITAFLPLIGTGAAIMGLVAGIAYIIANWKTVGKAVSDVFNAIGNILGAFVADIINNFKRVGEYIVKPFKAIGQAISGDFKGAAETLNDNLFAVFKDLNFNETAAAAKASAGVFSRSYHVAAEEISKDWTALKDKVGQVFNPKINKPQGGDVTIPGLQIPGGSAAAEAGKEGAKALKKMTEEMFHELENQGKHIKDLIDEVKDKAKEWRDITKSIEDAYYDVGLTLQKAGIDIDGLTGQSKTLQRTHKEIVSGLIDDMKRYASELVGTKSKIADVTKEIQKLKDEQTAALQKNQFENTRAVAEKIAELEKETADKKAKINLTSDHDEANKLMREVQLNEEILRSHTDFITANYAEVQRARDLSNMDEIAKMLALNTEKENAIKAEFEAKIKAAEQEKLLLEEKYATQLELLKNSNAALKAEQDKAQGDYAKYLKAAEDLTNSHVGVEIAKYNQLAAAIRNASKGVSSSFSPTQNDTLNAFINPPKLAEGGIVTKPTIAMIGEAGKEAVIPLSKGGMGGLGQTINIVINGDVTGEKLVDWVAEKLTKVVKYSTATV